MCDRIITTKLWCTSMKNPSRRNWSRGPADRHRQTLPLRLQRRSGARGRASTPLDVGRSNARCRRRSSARCTRVTRVLVPGCHRKRYPDAHHPQHWTDGGDTSLENLTLLCRHHHAAARGRLPHRARPEACFASMRRRAHDPRFGYRVEDFTDDFVDDDVHSATNSPSAEDSALRRCATPPRRARARRRFIACAASREARHLANGLPHHQRENHDDRRERRHAEPKPQPRVSPVTCVERRAVARATRARSRMRICSHTTGSQQPPATT